ncbi:MAG: leucine-rich repeat domain-containing protein, partial [Verrucomicrobia bacterium]|nr:leucine-rich repeat domain-containing protein [Verrucomicrobiota bacterium]
EQLSLENNNLISLPETIGNLSQLKQLSLENNNLISLPETIGNLLRLETLKLGNNKLNSLPETFGNLHQMSMLNLSDNDLESLPAAIGNLQQLSSFYILNNRLKSLPETFGNLQLLGTLALANNRLKDLPKSFGNLRSMRILDLSNNRLQGLPETFRNLQHQLEWLSFNGNLCLFMLDNKFSAFTSGMTKRILEKYGACQEYTPRTPLAKLCQLIHNQSDKNLLEPTLLSLPPAMQTKILSKMEDIWAALPEHQQVENNELPKADAVNPVFHERDEILNQAIIELLKETFSTLTQEQKRLVYDRVWDLAGRPESDHQFWDLTGKLQKDTKWGERRAEDNIIRLIDAMALVCEEGIGSSS